MRREINHFFIALKRLYKSVLGFEEGTDIPATIEGIKKDITFRGHSAWILIFSIFIASIGLNVNSTAVIIGAMLISPLMGPILGVGLSVGTNDLDTLIRSLKNLGIAIFISLFTSTFYFVITPLDIEQTELIARTKPTILDVLVALFGGFAGIIAGSRREKSNVIPGVAIATALMPPLCTAGYGLASLKFNYFFGAFYLFFINSVFISLATFIVVRYLKFPLIKFVDSERLKRYKIYLIVFLVVTITPSAVIFYKVIQETRFNVAVEHFINDKCQFEGSELLSYKYEHSDTLSVINLYYIGKKIDDDKKLYLSNYLNDYGLVSGKMFPITQKTLINVFQEEDQKPIDIDEKLTEYNKNFRIKILEDIYTKNEELIKDKELKIKLLEDEVLKLSKVDTIPYTQLGKELLYHFPLINKYSYAQVVELNNIKDSVRYDTIPVYLVNFEKGTRQSVRTKKLSEISNWLQVRMSDNSIIAVEY